MCKPPQSHICRVVGLNCLLFIALIFQYDAVAQTYNMTSGTINTCGGTFYDSGGAGGNYSNNSNITQTFCSSAGAGSCLQVQFTSFDTRNSADYLRIYDGAIAGVNLIGTYFGNLGAFNLPIVSSTGCLTFQFISNGSQTRGGWAATISCVPCTPAPGGGSILLHPTAGLQNTYVGACMRSVCNGTYYDNGGLASNYSNNINSIYWTFCPNTPGKCARASFHSFEVEPPGFFFYDYLTIRNGPTQFSPEFGTGSTWAGSCLTYQSCMGAGLGPYVSTDASGCLTFNFTSDFSVNLPGWITTIDCVPCSYGPTGATNSDCSGVTPICTNTPFSSVSTGPGVVSEGCSGCNLSENFSNWFTFQAQTSGVLQMTIDPVNNNDDYDFAIYGPNVTCLALGQPVRCSYASNTGNTGTNGTAIDVSEDVYGDGWVSNLNVVAGQSYTLMINKWSPGGSGYTIDWSGSTASLDCSILPVELLDFRAIQEDDRIRLTWSTAGEIDSWKYVLKRADNNLNFEPIGEVTARGNSTTVSEYNFYDASPGSGVQYYQLNQIDIDGESHDLGIASVKFSPNKSFAVKHVYYNNEGSVIVVFDSNSTEPCQIILNSGNGRKLYKKTYVPVSGSNELTLPLRNPASGIYFVTIFNSVEVSGAKFMVDTH